MRIKFRIKGIIPHGMWQRMREIRSFLELFIYKVIMRSEERRLKRKCIPIRVLFLAYNESVWKYDSLYTLMEKHEAFAPQILVCPHVRFGNQSMIEMMQKCYTSLVNKGYFVQKAYDETSDTYLLPEFLHPDILFYSSPYSGDIDERYTWFQNKSILSCYANYFYIGVNTEWSCATPFHLNVWRYYIENELLNRQIQHYVPYGVHNTRVVGYPLFDSFRNHKVINKEWKDKKKKRIIWAPHHTITGFESVNGLHFSTFLDIAYEMLKLAQMHKDQIEIAFKPHPLLKDKLYLHSDWGKEKTEAYFTQWKKGENTIYTSGDYVDLFLSSDAMIHDCDSFTVEYLYTQKPVMYMDAFNRRKNANEIAQKALDCHYIGSKMDDIERFIQEVVLGGKDDLSERRQAFYKNYILPPNGKLAAENIIDDLLTSLGRK